MNTPNDKQPADLLDATAHGLNLIEKALESPNNEIPLKVVSAVMLAARGNGQLVQCADDYQTNVRLTQIGKIDAAVKTLSGWYQEQLNKLNAAKKELEPGLEDYMRSRRAADPECWLIKLPGGELDFTKGKDSVEITAEKAELPKFAPSIYIKVETTYTPDKTAIMKALKAGEIIPFARIKTGDDKFHYRVTPTPEADNGQ